MRVKLPHINTVRRRLADGTVRVYRYHRRTGALLEGEPGTDAFLKSYAEASTRQRKDDGSFASLIDAYKRSPAYTQTAGKTQKDYLRYLDALKVEFGDTPVSLLDDRRMRGDFLDWRDEMAGTPRTADYAWSVLRRVLSWAVDRGKLQHNVALRPGRLYEGDRADKIWTDEHIAAFCAVAGPEMRAALVLAVYTGQRQKDLLGLSRRAYDGQWIRLRQSKGRRLVDIPAHKTLRAMLDAIPKERPATTVLVTAKGRPWKQDHFRHEWRAATLAAGLDGLHFHDLRGTAITGLTEAGCTAQQVAAITGHSIAYVEGILEVYTARTRKLALSAMRLWENAG